MANRITRYLSEKEFKRERRLYRIFRKQIENGERTGIFDFHYIPIKPKGLIQRIWWHLNSIWKMDGWSEERPVGASDRVSCGKLECVLCKK